MGEHPWLSHNEASGEKIRCPKTHPAPPHSLNPSENGASIGFERPRASNLGNASSHDNRNMPVLFAGGGFKHGKHLAFDQKRNYALPNLYLDALHQLGLQQESFATSSGGMTGMG